MNTEQLIKQNREDERKTLAFRSASRLDSLAAHILNHKLDYAASAALLVAEAEKYEHEAQELNHV
ncbi:DUF2732 family protein [Xenorhabdus sp. Sc-CR9]|uniref:DUF2732 family protein n=1 Tax=Xenorhabdus sp. Sc-CR9 TaxID=2584468 RepID=UPI001F257276|nr:DUF2732 family protein [Xenorhabdus sp. Sc-CR9]